MKKTHSLTAAFSAVQATFWMSFCMFSSFAAVYLLALGYVVVIFLLCAVGVLKKTAGAERTLMLTAMAAAGLLPVSLLLPAIFKVGAAKGRIFYYVIYIGSLILTYGAAGVGASDGVGQAVPVLGPGAFFAALLVLLALFALSWFLSVRFYRKREL